MRRIISMLFVSVFLLTGCLGGQKIGNDPDNISAKPADAAVTTQNKADSSENDDTETDSDQTESMNADDFDTTEDKVNYQLENMTLDEKIGQMLIVFYRSDKMDDTLQSALEDVKPGGFILFGENFTTYDKTLEMIKAIKATSSVPMIMSVDQEGGIVQRLEDLSDADVTDFPSMYYLGETLDTKLAYDTGKAMAEEMKVFGINVDFAPCLDIFSNPNNTVIGYRAFGSDAQTVTTMAFPFSDGLSENGIVPVFKHFPGHGDTDADSHYSLPVITKTKEELDDFELIPFKQAIENNVPIIMVGHLALPNITSDDTPASLSKEVVTDFLKSKLGFKGLVVSDALNMEALTDNYTEKEIYTMAIEAGVDLLLMPSSSRTALSSIKESISEGAITKERIDESVRKILTFKYDNLTDDNYLDESYLGSEEHKNIVDQIPVE